MSYYYFVNYFYWSCGQMQPANCEIKTAAKVTHYSDVLELEGIISKQRKSMIVINNFQLLREEKRKVK